ncbi:MAG: hypothetical protein JWO19_4967 [Bryobacterales bacterium]|nr:hypothetical protein [Bryobacterales bacterium]
MPLPRTGSRRKRLLVHLSQAVETLGLKKAPITHVVPFEGALHGNVKIQFFDVSRHEFGHFESISKALIRLDQGTYGRCTYCRKRIESEVLAETPWATLCLECGDQESQP